MFYNKQYVIMYIFSLVEPKYFPLRVMNIMKSITENQIFKEHSEVKKHLSGGELWNYGGYIGTIGMELLPI